MPAGPRPQRHHVDNGAQLTAWECVLAYLDENPSPSNETTLTSLKVALCSRDLCSTASACQTRIHLPHPPLTARSGATPETLFQRMGGTLQHLHINCRRLPLPMLLPLRSLKHLHLKSMDLQDLKPLAGLTTLTHLVMHENTGDAMDLAPLLELRNLRHLELHSCGVTELSPLQDLAGLAHLSVAWNSVTSLQPLSALTALTWLRIGGTPEGLPLDVGGLSALVELSVLDLSDTHVPDVVPLASLTSLVRLVFHDYYGYKARQQLGSFSALQSLEHLALTGVGVTDVGFLSALTRLTALSLAMSRVEDISPLSTLQGLQWLDMTHTVCRNCKPLALLPRLEVTKM